MKGQKALKPIALIKTGSTIEQIKLQHGDFEDWFADGLGVSDLLQIDVFRQQPLPAAETLAAIVVTGSASMVSAGEDWSERTAEWLGQAVQKGTPVLGVCYGHQLLAHALGGRVGLNPGGRQIGTVTTQRIDSAENDPLIGGLPQTFAAQTSHSEVVLELPPGAERLAGVQFHPEFSMPVMSEYIQYRAEALREEGLSPERLLEKTTDTEDAKTVLRQFAAMYREG